MSLRFSERGPEIPSALIDALMAGNVVFLCGTGISAPQLPDFKALVDGTYARLGVEKDSSERRSYDGGRFEEVLGALGRRLADSEGMVRAVSELLAVPADPMLDQHNTILRLSRDLSNRVLTVTTNFDTLLERALRQPPETVRSQSFAGQALPAPGGAGFSGIIHIHGRLADQAVDIESTPLVLTSADYGDAYMRSGWASRFLFDLARCKTIVLVGYSAADAPVRYFLNVLEADRARFPELRTVYAFDAYEGDPIEAEAAWGTVAVTPLAYCKFNPETGVPDHSPLWGDLRQLADVIERPKRSRAERARRILVGETTALDDQRLRELSWLFADSGDLWSVAIDAITDSRWFKILHENKLWSRHDAAWVIAAWIARNFEDRERFAAAIEWHEILGNDFFLQLEKRAHQAPPTSPFWLKAWRILLSAKPSESKGVNDFDVRTYVLKQKLASGLILDSELAQAVAVLTPVLVASPVLSIREDDHSEAEDQPAELRLDGLAWFDLNVIDEAGADDIIGALTELDAHAGRILDLSCDALRTSAQQAVDLGMIVEDYDTSDFSVPSIEIHAQNEYRDGVLFLVRMIVGAFPKAVAADRDRARARAAQWAAWPGRLGLRLLLHVSRDAAAFSADEAMQVLLDLGDADFWIIRREVALVLLDRSAEASRAKCELVEARIQTSGDAYYARFQPEEGQADWRAYARDSVVWLRLKMLDAAGVISDAGRGELAAIVARRPYLDREVEDPDFFGSYSHEARFVEGDSAPIQEADPDARLKVAAELNQSPDIDRKLGWRAYCRSDPKGAFETLVVAELTAPNIALWHDLLATLAVLNDEKDAPLRDEIAADAMAQLERLDIGALRAIATSAVDLLRFGPRRRIVNLEDWCDRLWAAVRLEDYEIDFEKGLYNTALNRTAGRLTQVLLAELDHTRKGAGPEEARQRARLLVVADDDGPAGVIARAILMHDFAYLLATTRELVEDHLLPRLTLDDDEGRALRAVLVTHSNVTSDVTKLAGSQVLRGVIEARPESGFEGQIASCILRPALALVRGEDPDLWGIQKADISRALHEAPLRIRVGTLGVLVRWMRNNDVENGWEKVIAPFFDRIWPKERRFVDEAQNRNLMALAVGAGEKFSAALAALRSYFSPYARERASVYPIIQSTAPEDFPAQVLDLLWLILGSTGESTYETGEILDRIVAADPNLELDRRLQSLEQRTVRYQ